MIRSILSLLLVILLLLIVVIVDNLLLLLLILHLVLLLLLHRCFLLINLLLLHNLLLVDGMMLFSEGLASSDVRLKVGYLSLEGAHGAIRVVELLGKVLVLLDQLLVFVSEGLDLRLQMACLLLGRAQICRQRLDPLI